MLELSHRGEEGVLVRLPGMGLRCFLTGPGRLHPSWRRKPVGRSSR